MSFTPAIPLDAIDAAFGEKVIVDPDGEPRVATAVRFAPDADAFLGSPRRTATVILEMQAVAAAGIAEGTVIEIDCTLGNDGQPIAGTGERRIVQGEPEATDDLRLVRRIDTRPA